MIHILTVSTKIWEMRQLGAREALFCNKCKDLFCKDVYFCLLLCILFCCHSNTVYTVENGVEFVVWIQNSSQEKRRIRRAILWINHFHLQRTQCYDEESISGLNIDHSNSHAILQIAHQHEQSSSAHMSVASL